jgi:1-acyl-sn-glycerol-3-phosphate acyltransferase
VKREVDKALDQSDIFSEFPEGTVTDDTTLQPFKGSLLQPIIDAAGHVQPVAIRYRTRAGGASTAATAYHDTHFLGSLWRICGAPALVVELTATPPLPAQGKRRRELAGEAEAVIRAVLALPAIDREPGRRADRETGSP